MKKCKHVGLTNSSGDRVGSSHSFGTILTKAGKVLKELQETVLSLENGKKIYGYIKITPQEDKLPYCEPYPKEFKKAITVLSYLGASAELIDEAPNKKTKDKYIMVTLTPEQEAELQKLKTLCN